MIHKVKTRDVQKQLFVNYVRKSEECFHAAKTCFERNEWNAAAINAIHACISGCDAVCVFYLGKRYAGDNHNEAVALFRGIDDNDGIGANTKRLSRILSIKNMAEYEERLVFRKEAEEAVKDCARFLDFVKDMLPKDS